MTGQGGEDIDAEERRRREYADRMAAERAASAAGDPFPGLRTVVEQWAAKTAALPSGAKVIIGGGCKRGRGRPRIFGARPWDDLGISRSTYDRRRKKRMEEIRVSRDGIGELCLATAGDMEEFERLIVRQRDPLSAMILAAGAAAAMNFELKWKLFHRLLELEAMARRGEKGDEHDGG